MSSGEPISLGPNIEIVVATSNEVFARIGQRTVSLAGIPLDDIRAILAAIDGRHTVDEITQQLRHQYKPQYVRNVIDSLRGIAVQGSTPQTNPTVARPLTAGISNADPDTLKRPVAVFGNGRLAAGLREAFVADGFSACQPFDIRSFASYLDERFLAELQNRVLVSPIRSLRRSHPRWLPFEGHVLEQVTISQLRRLLEPQSLLVCALEYVPYRAILDVNQSALLSGTPAIFVTVDSTEMVVGPTLVPYKTACFECERLACVFQECDEWQTAVAVLPFFYSYGLADSPWDQHLINSISFDVVREAKDILAKPPTSALLAGSFHLSLTGAKQFVPVFPSAHCSQCASTTSERRVGATTVEEPLSRRAVFDLGLAMDRHAVTQMRGSLRSSEDAYRTVGILGGGTAGYLAALVLRARLPHLDVTLIESSDIPIIGVGEATTPRLVEFLHSPQDLGQDIVEFHRRVLPTLKLGILYYWGLPGDYAFPWPFQYGSLLEPLSYDGNIDAHCLGALLMLAGRIPVIDYGDGSYSSLLHLVPFAYHLDNQRFVRYLREEAEKAGVRLVNRAIIDASLTPSAEEIDFLLAADGEKFSFDLYVDCSGFQSLLIGKKLGSEFISYEKSLYTDAAVVANVPHGGTIKPYTLAETMNHGWCWNIPFDDEDHRGYVFSSSFTTFEGAAEEMRAKNPAMSDYWTLRFRSGRHEHFWKGNVVALGNAYAFVEPLASTAIHMILHELDLFITNFPASKQNAAIKRSLNTRLNLMWDNLRGWLAVQYKFNRKLDTPFWQACRAHVDLAGAADRVELFRERAPLSNGSSLFRSQPDRLFLPQYGADYFSQEYVYDVMLAGQQVPARYVEPTESKSEWCRRAALLRDAVRWALPQKDALALLRGQRPDMLSQIIEDPASWVLEQTH